MATNQTLPEIKLPLTGSRVVLDALRDEDLESLLGFFSDLASLYYYIPTTARPLNREQVARLLDDWNDGRSSFVFAVRVGGTLCGIVNLADLDWPNGTAEVGVALTAASHRGRGYAGEALGLLIDYAFAELGLARLWARIIAGNQASIRLFSKLGFQYEGALRAHVLRSGLRRDMRIYGLLREEWTAAHDAPVDMLR